MAEVKLNWNLTEQSPQNQIGAPDQLCSELNLRPPDRNRTTPKPSTDLILSEGSKRIQRQASTTSTITLPFAISKLYLNFLFLVQFLPLFYFLQL